MISVVILVLNNPDQLNDVLSAWQDAGAPGVTALESIGLGRALSASTLDDVPLFPSLHDILEHKHSSQYTLFSVVDDDEVVNRIITATERVVGDLSQPDTGILFVMPTLRVVGGQRVHRSSPSGR